MINVMSWGVLGIERLVVSELALGNQRFPVRVQLLAMYRGELSEITTRLMRLSVCEAGGSGREELNK